MARLIVTADDYGYGARYDDGILEAARCGAIDAVSAFARRSARGPEPLISSGVEIGLHLELGAGGEAARADARERAYAGGELERQLAAFRERFGREPAHLDGHHHCHARDGLGTVVSDFAAERGLPVRSADRRHRRLLRCRGVATPDLLVGRTAEDDPALPAELDPTTAIALPEAAVVEWMVHPGRSDPGLGSRYDRGREQDLELLLAWEPPAGVERATHAEALAAAG